MESVPAVGFAMMEVETWIEDEAIQRLAWMYWCVWMLESSNWNVVMRQMDLNHAQGV